MFFGLKKVVGFWLMPLPFALVLVATGLLLLRFTRRRTLGRLMAACGGVWLLACSNVGFGTWLVRSLECQFPAQPVITAESPPPPNLTRCRVVAVLGGGHCVQAGWSANQALSASALARIVEGVRLVRQLPNAQLVVSGPQDGREGGPTHAALLREVAVALGVPSERIIQIDTARDTEQEALALRALAAGEPVALVSSAWHLPRAMALCRGQGLDVLACPTDYAARPPRLRFVDFLSWNLGGLERSTKAVYEYIGASWSRLRGRA
jgi:uncharacterized SAM-binding protein YcdF (DUF218 family)